MVLSIGSPIVDGSSDAQSRSRAVVGSRSAGRVPLASGGIKRLLGQSKCMTAPLAVCEAWRCTDGTEVRFWPIPVTAGGPARAGQGAAAVGHPSRPGPCAIGGFPRRYCLPRIGSPVGADEDVGIGWLRELRCPRLPRISG